MSESIREKFFESLRKGTCLYWGPPKTGMGGAYIELRIRRHRDEEILCAVCEESVDCALSVDSSGSEYPPLVICTPCVSMVTRAAPMSFGEAVCALKLRQAVCRASWRERGFWLELEVQPHKHPYIAIVSPHDRRRWRPSHQDMLTNDWFTLGSAPVQVDEKTEGEG